MASRSRRGLATWLTSSILPLFVLDERNVVLVFNRGCELLTGWPASEVIGQECRWQSGPAPDAVSSVTGALAPPIDATEGLPVTVRKLFLHRNGTAVERDVHFFPLLPEKPGEKTHLIGLVIEAPAASQPSSRHVEAARHLAELQRRFGADRLVAKSPGMQRVAAQVALARDSRVAVHLVGERGSGREHLARLIHYSGSSRSTPWIPLRCRISTHTELKHVVERLLGERPAGQEAQQVTAYLEDVHRLPVDLQALIAQNRETPGLQWMSSAEVEMATLPSDEILPEFASLLTTLTITLPPLRSRHEDILLLTQQLIEEGNSRGSRQIEGLTPAVERLFLQYEWPGNVDELASVIHRAAENCPGGLIDVLHLPFDFAAGQDAQQMRPAKAAVSLDDALAHYEKHLIETALVAARGNKSTAAELLQIPRAKLYRRIESLGIADRGSDAEE